MKILVTGANGFLGTGIVEELLKTGNQIIATDLCTDRVNKSAELISGDIFATENPFDYFGKPDVLLHLAWRDGFVHNSSAHIDDLHKHATFIKKMIDSDIKQVAVLGTMHEIGFYEGEVNENTPCNPSSLYGISKNALRGITELYCKQSNVIFQWLRGFYIVSPSEYGNSIFSKLFKSADSGKMEFPFTSGKNKYDFLTYDEFSRQVACCVCQKSVNGIINICSGTPESLSSRVEKFITDNKLDIKLNYGVYPDRPYDSKEIWGDASKIRAIMKRE